MSVFGVNVRNKFFCCQPDRFLNLFFRNKSDVLANLKFSFSNLLNCHAGHFAESGKMFVNLTSQEVWSNEVKMLLGVNEQVSNFSIGVENAAKDNVCVNDYLRLIKRLRFFAHQDAFTSSASLSTSDCFALLLAVASRYFT